MKSEELVSQWITKAKRDLASAKKLLTGEPKIFDTSCFHSQQCAEKIIKAYLVFKNISFSNKHQLSYLLDLCEKGDNTFSSIREQAELLDPYAVETRYPDASFDPDESTSIKALETAERIFKFVSSKINFKNPLFK